MFKKYNKSNLVQQILQEKACSTINATASATSKTAG
jgi:hypothetical protein